MRHTIRILAGGATALACLAAPAAAQRQEEQVLDWSGAVAPGKALVVRNLNGGITIRAADGDRARIVAVKRWRNGDPSRVRVELRRAGSDDGTVVACAFWREDASCDEDGYRGGDDRGGWRRNDGDVSVAFEVRVPRGVRVVTSSVNGGLDITGATAGIDAETVNGGIVARTSGGPVQARTVNGGLDVTLGSVVGADLEFETVNGDVSLRVPEGLDADLSMSTVNGGVSSELPVTVEGRIRPKQLRATLGKGGPRLSLTTVNGNVRLRRG